MSLVNLFTHALSADAFYSEGSGERARPHLDHQASEIPIASAGDMSQLQAANKSGKQG